MVGGGSTYFVGVFRVLASLVAAERLLMVMVVVGIRICVYVHIHM